jgi:hypothetical protein
VAERTKVTLPQVRAELPAAAGAVIRDGLAAHVREVTDRSFPRPEHWFGMKDEGSDALVRLLDVDTP